MGKVAHTLTLQSTLCVLQTEKVLLRMEREGEEVGTSAICG